VIRDRDGHILDIIEEDQASIQVKEIRELNVGAYVVRARKIWPALDALQPSPQDGEYRLTSSVAPADPPRIAGRKLPDLRSG